MTSPANKPSLFLVFLIVAVLATSLLAFALARKNRDLKFRLEAIEQALIREQTKDSLAVGEIVGNITLFDARGARHDLTFPAKRPVLLLLISTHCPYCDETIPVWQRIFRETQATTSATLDILCVQADARKSEDLKQLEPPLMPHWPQSPNTTWLSRIPISPGALLIDESGVVRKTWFGVPSDRDQQQIASAILGAR